MKQVSVCVLFFLLILPSVLFSQAVPLNEFTVYGVSKIDDGDLAKARQEALLDAQRKVVMNAVCARVSIEDMIKYSLTLKDIYYNSYSFFLDSFRILNEYEHFGIYTLAVQGVVNEAALINELASAGIMTVEEKSPTVLFMIAEKSLEDEGYRYWWSNDSAEKNLPGNISSRLSYLFRERGFQVIDPLNIEPASLREQNISEIDPDISMSCNIAFEYGAKYLVIGMAELVRTESPKASPLVNIQCNIQAGVFDTESKNPLVHISTFKPGTHIDEISAINDAIEKASESFSEKVFNRIYSHTKDTKQYKLKIKLNTKDAEKASERIVETIRNIFPDLQVINIQKTEDILLIITEGKMPGADISEGLLSTDIDGFSLEFISAKDYVLEFNFLKKIN